MKELLLELFSEEIPARMQEKSSSIMLSELENTLKEQGITYSKAKYLVTPRRIVIHIEGLPEQLPQQEINRKGPKIDARPEAIEGFLKAVEMRLEELTINDGFYYAKKIEKAKNIDGELKLILEKLLLTFTWPKSMRSAQSEVRWVRPLRNILCIFGSEILPIEFGGLKANNKTWGHRFMCSDEFLVKSFVDYEQVMKKSFVILSSKEREAIIIEQINEIATKLNLIPIIEPDLLKEVVGLVEYPNVVLGKIDPEYTILPKEVLVTAMKVHQRYFYLENNKSEISPYFLTVLNVKLDSDEAIVAGNEKVLKARLADAKYFWEKDLKLPSSEALAKLAKMTFHSKLGSMFDKVNRIIEIAKFIGEDLLNDELIKKAALLCKTDLVSEMVGEFPELQGVMGKYYALHDGVENEVAYAIAEHYRPIDVNDQGNISLLGAIISIADKMDSLVGLWSAGEKPTSSKDPFALRRTALGIIKLIRFHKLNFSLKELINYAGHSINKEQKEEIIIFINERLKYYLKNENFRHDLVMASLANNADNINSAIERIIELENYFKDDVSKNLLFSIKRILNIIGDNEVSLEVNYDFFNNIEKSLYNKVIGLKEEISSLASITEDINLFFDKVMVNDIDPNIKKNRLNLLFNVANVASKIADFSLIEG